LRRIALALVHYPVLDRARATVTTAITNLDLHDMSRSARTYGASELFVVHPVAAQRMLAERIREHWVMGSGRRRIPDRGDAMELVRVVPSLEDAYTCVAGDLARAGVELWTTAASARGEVTPFPIARERLATAGRPIVLVFGTGWGLADELVANADVRLEPIRARLDTRYNHLSVRAACAITLDRLFG
jgi:hypothetical protein